MKADLGDFQKLDTDGMLDSPVDPCDSEVSNGFCGTLRYEAGRYFVNWSWKNNLGIWKTRHLVVK